MSEEPLQRAQDECGASMFRALLSAVHVDVASRGGWVAVGSERAGPSVKLPTAQGYLIDKKALPPRTLP